MIKINKLSSELRKYDGCLFSCKIQGDHVEGRISVGPDRIYLCQNKFDGARAPNTFEYSSSWAIDSAVEDEIIVHEGSFTLTDCHERTFSAIISGNKAVGMVFVRGFTVYLLQNAIAGDAPGSDVLSRYGFAYSWNVSKGDADGLRENEVSDFKITGKWRATEPKIDHKAEVKEPLDKTITKQPFKDRLGIKSSEITKEHHGCWFEAKIKGKRVVGRISYEGCIPFLCQDDFDGVSCSDKFGFKYSWVYDNNVEFVNLFLEDPRPRSSGPAIKTPEEKFEPTSTTTMPKQNSSIEFLKEKKFEL